MRISKPVLLAGLRQLSSTYKGKNGIENITVQLVNGVPAYVMHGQSPQPPDGLPGRMRVPDMDGKAVAVAVLWRQSTTVPLPTFAPTAVPTAPSPDWLNAVGKPTQKLTPSDDRDVSDQMWRGFVNIDRKDTVTEFFPGSDHIVTQGEIPKAVTTELQVSTDITGEWGFWTKPFDLQGCICCTFYAQPTLVLSYTVPQDYALTLDGWAFFINGPMSLGESFRVQFIRDGDTLLDYIETVVDPLNPDPGKRCAFSGGPEQVMRSYLRIDRNQTLTVWITPLGLYPYTPNPADTFCVNICCLLHGHMEALLDNRDGAPRPKDVGRLRDDLNGDATLDEVTPEDVKQLYQWLDGATANAAVPTEPTSFPTTVPPTQVPVTTPASSGLVAGGALAAAIIAAASLGEDGIPTMPD